MTTRLSLLDSRHEALVNELRLGEYAGARGFTVKPPGILWNRSDEQAVILGAWDGDDLVATLRLEAVESRDLVEAKLECPWNFPVPLRLPALLLSKMAICKAYRRTGVSEAMRHHALRLAQEWGLPQVLGTMVAGAPRRPAMERMGYRFFANDLGWQTTNYRSEQPVFVCALDVAAHGEQAMTVCGELAGSALTNFPWDGPQPVLRIVSVVQ